MKLILGEKMKLLLIPGFVSADRLVSGLAALPFLELDSNESSVSSSWPRPVRGRGNISASGLIGEW